MWENIPSTKLFYDAFGIITWSETDSNPQSSLQQCLVSIYELSNT